MGSTDFVDFGDLAAASNPASVQVAEDDTGSLGKAKLTFSSVAGSTASVTTTASVFVMGNAFTAQAHPAAAVSGLAQLMSDATVTGGALDGMTERR